MYGCTSKYRIRDGEFKPHKEYRFLTVITVDDEVYYFDSGAYFVDDHIECCAHDSSFVQIPVEDVKLAYERNFDFTKTLYYTVGVTALVVLYGLIWISVALADFFDS
jgi:hypothetical protein